MFLLLAPVIFFTFIYVSFDKSDYKSYIETAFLEATGLTLSIEGDARLGFSKVLQLSAENVVIKTPEQVNLVTAKQFDASLNLANLLKKRWQIDEVLLSQVSLNIEKNNRGNFIFAKAQTGESPSEDTELLSVLPFRKLSIKDSRLVYKDPSSDFGFTLNNLNLLLEENKKIAVADLKFDYVAQTGQQGQVNAYAELEFGDQVKINNLKNQIRLKHDDIYYDLIIAGDILTDKYFSDIRSDNLSLSSDSFALQSDIDIVYLPGKTTINLDLKALNAIPLIQWITSQPVNVNSQGLLIITNSELKFVLENQKLSVDIAALQLGETKLVGEFSYHPGQADQLSESGQSSESNQIASVYTKVKLDQLQLDQYLGLQSLMPVSDSSQSNSGINFDVSLQINRLMFEDALVEPFINRTIMDTGAWRSEGQFNVINLNPSKLVTKATFLSEDLVKKLEPFKKIEGNLKYQLNENHLIFSDADLTVNETKIIGNFDYQPDKTAIYSDLTIGELNLDNYQWLFSQHKDDQDEPESNPVGIAVEQLKSFNGEGNIRINKLTYQGVEYQGINIQFTDS